MINKIIASTIFFFMLISLSLALFGVQHVNMSTPFMSFLSSCNRELNTFLIAIPEIPHIPVAEIIDLESGGEWILDWFINFANGFFNFVNFLITLINVITTIINTIIQLIEFVFIILKNVIVMRDELLTQ